MKLKYYLRGIGIGIIVTTIIFTIAQMIVSGRDKAVAAGKEQGTTSGSVLAYTQKEKEETTQAETTQAQTTQAATTETQMETTQEETTQEETTQEETTQENTQEITQPPTNAVLHLQNDEEQIEIGSGCTATQVADMFYEAGIIDDRDGFISYMVESGNSVKMIAGLHIVKKGDSFENLAQIITTK